MGQRSNGCASLSSAPQTANLKQYEAYASRCAPARVRTTASLPNNIQSGQPGRSGTTLNQDTRWVGPGKPSVGVRRMAVVRFVNAFARRSDQDFRPRRTPRAPRPSAFNRAVRVLRPLSVAGRGGGGAAEPEIIGLHTDGFYSAMTIPTEC